MWKIILLSHMLIFFVGCGEEVSSSDDNDKYLSIARAPINTQPVPIKNVFLFKFSDESDESSVDENSAYIEDIALMEKIGVELDVKLDEISFTPYEYFVKNKNYRLVITKSVQSNNAKSLKANYSYEFLTANDFENNASLNFVQIKPKNAADPKTEIVLQFNENITPEPVHKKLTIVEVRDIITNELVVGTSEFFNSNIIFKPDDNLSNGVDYNVSLITMPKDMYGNDYNASQPTSWTISIHANALNNLKINDGYKSLFMHSTENITSKIRAYKIGLDDYLAVSNDKFIEFYKASQENGLPTLEYKYQFQTDSAVNEMGAYFGYFVAATQSKGLYVLSTNTADVELIQNLESNTSIYGLTSLHQGVNYLYAVGPNYGIKQFSMGINGNLTYIKDTNLSNIEPLKISSASNIGVNTLYVADYKNDLLIFDHNLSLVKSVDLNKTTRDIAINEEGSSSLKFVLTNNSLGSSYTLDLDGNISANGYTEPISTTIDMSKLKDTFTSKSRVFLSQSTNGVTVLNTDLGLSSIVQESIIDINSSVMSTAVFDIKPGSSNKILYYLAVLNHKGDINIFNALQDTVAPLISSIDTNATSVSINFSEYLDLNSLTKEDIIYKDENNQLVEFVMNTTVTDDGSGTKVILTPANMGNCDDTAPCTISIPANAITDLVKNFNNLISENFYDPS